MITIREIAADADVSVSTVSIVLGRRSDQLKVSAATRKKVLDSAKRLGYCRNLLASQMQSGKTQIFSFLAPEHNDYIMQIFSGVVHQAQQLGFYCKFYEVMQDPEESHRLYYEVLGMRPEAIIIHAALAECNYFLEQANALGIPVACVDRIPEKTVQVAVVSDSVEGMVKMVDHLYAMGHRRIGFFSHPMEQWEFVRQRYQGFCKGMTIHHCRIVPEWNIDQPEQMEPYLKKIRETPDAMPTAICCASDFVALELMMTAQRLGLSIPEELSVMGYGALRFCDSMSPKLVSMDQHFFELGEKAALLICDYLSLKKSKPLIQTVIPTIHAGDSVGHPSDAGKKQQSRGNPLHVSSGSPHSSRGDAGDRLKNCKTRK